MEGWNGGKLVVIIVAGEVLTPIIISVGQLMADDRSDPAIVHRPGSRSLVY